VHEYFTHCRKLGSFLHAHDTLGAFCETLGPLFLGQTRNGGLGLRNQLLEAARNECALQSNKGDRVVASRASLK
jgi:hypothetical protein